MAIWLTEKPGEAFSQYVDRRLKVEVSRFDTNNRKGLLIFKGHRKADLLMLYAELLDTYGELCLNDELHEQYSAVNELVKK